MGKKMEPVKKSVLLVLLTLLSLALLTAGSVFGAPSQGGRGQTAPQQDPASTTAGTVIIDTFDVSQGVLSLDSPDGVGKTISSSVPLLLPDTTGSILGGQRDMSISLISSLVGTNGIDAQVAGGAYSYSQDPTVHAKGELQWDGMDGSGTLDATGLGGLDLSNAFSKDSILLSLLFDDLPIDMNLKVYSSANDYSSYALPLPGSILVPKDVVIPYKLFEKASGNGADFTNVGAITLDIDSVSAPDLVIDLVAAVSRLRATKVDSVVVDNDGNGVASPGDTLRYTVVILNYADLLQEPVGQVVFRSGVNPNSTLVVGSVTTTLGTVTLGNTPGNNSVEVQVGTLVDNQNVTITFDVLIDNPLDAGIESIECQGTVAYEGQYEILTDDPDAPGDEDATVTPIIAAPDFTVTKTDGGVRTAPGQTIIYTINYANVGNQNATGVVLKETVPANTTFNAGASTAGWVCSPGTGAGSNCNFAIGPLTGGGAGSGTLQFALNVINPLPADVSQIANTACADDDHSNGPDPTPSNNCDEEPTPVDAQPDLHVLKTANTGSIEPGGTVIYTFAYSNAGNQAATGVSIVESVPEHTTFNAGASSPGWTCTPNNQAGSTCRLNLGTVNGGANGTRLFAVNVVNPLPAGVTSITNRACIEDDGVNGSDPNADDNCDGEGTSTSAEPDLRMVKTGNPARITPGGTVVYTLAYSNIGDQDATGVVLAETVPAHTTFDASSSSPGWICLPNNNAGSACSFIVGALAAGGNGSTLFAVKVVNPLPVGVTETANTACIEDDGLNGPDPTPANDCDEEDTPIDAQPDLRMQKDDGGVTAERGQILVYTLTYANVGNQNATGVALTETVPTYTTFVAGQSAAGWACTPNANAGSTCRLTIGALAAGANGTALFAVRVDNPLPNNATLVENAACIEDDDANGADPTPSNDCDDEDTPIRPPTPTPTITPTPTRSRIYFPIIVRPQPTPTPTPTPTATPLPITTPTIIPVPELAHPKGVAVNPKTNRIYVASRDNDALMVVDGNINQRIARIAVCDEPFGVAVNSTTNKVYVACFRDETVMVIDGANNTVKKAIQVGPEPTYVGINEKTNRVYVVTYGNNGVAEINGANDTYVGVRGVGAGAFGLAVNENLNQVYVTARDVGTIWLLDAANGLHVMGTIQPGDERDIPFGVGFNPVTNKLYATYTVQGFLTRVGVYRVAASGLTRESTITIPDGGKDGPGDLGIDTARNHIFIVNSASNSVSVIDGRTNTILKNEPIPGDPFGIAVNPVTRRAYVSTRNSNKLWVIPDLY